MSGEENEPTFSVVVPSYARTAPLRRCLDALSRLEGTSFEVLVVDDGSPDPVENAVADMRDAMNLTVVRQANQGPAAARNKGAAMATGRFLAFTDDDCRPRPDWLLGFLPLLEEEPDALLGGHTVNAETGNVYSQASQDLVGFLCGEGDGALSFYTSNNIACTRRTFLALSGFDEAFPLAAGEDRDLSMRWAASGRPLLPAPSSVVDHHHTLDAKRFLKQHTAYGQGARTLALRLAERGEETRPGPRGLGFYAGLLAYPFKAGGGKAPQRAGLLALSQLATAWGFFRGARRG